MIGTPSLFPVCPVPATLWDGETVCEVVETDNYPDPYGDPTDVTQTRRYQSASESEITPVVGPGTGYPMGLTLDQMMELLYRARAYRFAHTVAGTMSASTSEKTSGKWAGPSGSRVWEEVTVPSTSTSFSLAVGEKEISEASATAGKEADIYCGARFNDPVTGVYSWGAGYPAELSGSGTALDIRIFAADIRTIEEEGVVTYYPRIAANIVLSAAPQAYVAWETEGAYFPLVVYHYSEATAHYERQYATPTNGVIYDNVEGPDLATHSPRRKTWAENSEGIAIELKLSADSIEFFVPLLAIGYFTSALWPEVPRDTPFDTLDVDGETGATASVAFTLPAKIIIEVIEWWPYNDSEGEPNWDTDTGSPLTAITGAAGP